MGKLISEIFDPRSIILDLGGKTKDKILVELIESIAVIRPECDRTDFFTAIMDREVKMNTGIGNGVAVPHAYCKEINNMAGAIGISKQGINYDALDNKPVHIVFLLGINQKASGNHLNILNKIFILAQSEALALIKNAKNAEEIHAILDRL
jgi:mannitol/fructose-specific phosphotransferase system IIA component (Ntr-type)